MFSKELEQSIASLFDQAQKSEIEYITIEHLLLMILDDYEVKDALESNNLNTSNLKDLLEEYVRDTTPRKKDNNKPVQPTLGFQRVLQRSVFHVQSSGKGVVKPINILVAIFSEKESHSAYLLLKHGISRLDIVSYLSHGKSDTNKPKKKKITTNESELDDKDGALIEENSYLIDLNNLAENGKIDKLVGRDKEIHRLIQILARRTKNNPLLVGESGVGKTAIAEGLAKRIIDGEVPEVVAESEIFLLDLNLEILIVFSRTVLTDILIIT